MKKIDLACVIDDDPIYIFGIRKILEIANICESILIFHNGKEAYDKLSAIIKNGENIPDLILLDLNMPIWDGWRFLDEFIKIPIEKVITIFVVSSSIDPEDIEKAKTYEAVSNYVVKPITVDKLKQLFRVNLV